MAGISEAITAAADESDSSDVDYIPRNLGNAADEDDDVFVTCCNAALVLTWAQ